MTTHTDHTHAVALREQYDRDGFVVIEGSARDLVEHLRALTVEWQAQVVRDVGLPLGDLHRLIGAWGYKSGIVRELLTAAVGTAFAAARHVAPVAEKPVDATLFVKSPQATAATHAHQDVAYRWYRPAEERYALTTWIALDDCDGETSALSFLPGSHREPVSLRQDFLDPEFHDRAASPEWIARACTTAVRAGDIVVFDARVWHAAAVFRGQGLRRALAVRWRNPEGEQFEVPRPVPQRRFGIDTSGRLLRSAVRNVLPHIEPDTGSGTVLQMLRWLAAERVSMPLRLPDEVWDALRELELALRIEESHAGRSTAHAWLRIRDEVIPELERLSREGRQS